MTRSSHPRRPKGGGSLSQRADGRLRRRGKLPAPPFRFTQALTADASAIRVMVRVLLGEEVPPHAVRALAAELRGRVKGDAMLHTVLTSSSLFPAGWAMAARMLGIICIRMPGRAVCSDVRSPHDWMPALPIHVTSIPFARAYPANAALG